MLSFGAEYSIFYPKVYIKICTTIILPVLLYGRETWSLTLKEERRLRLLENRVLRRIFGPKRDEITSEWRKLMRSLTICIAHHILSGDKLEKNVMGGAYSACGG